MNQILFNKAENNKKTYIFKLQFIFSTIFAFITIITIYLIYAKEENLEKISKILNKNIKLYSVYNVEKTEEQEDLYLGKIIIEKIKLEYAVFNLYNEELLKISPCKFYGKSLKERSNICIAAHNYNDDRFFGRIDELEVKDMIKIEDFKGNEYIYTIYDIFEIKDSDFSILKAKKIYELTLLTCNNSNNKRIIIKAYRKEY